MRKFESGATRDTEEGKLDYEGFLSPLVLRRFAEYMHKHRHQTDGALRASDNWQKGIPLDGYIKSLWRHFMDLWSLHRTEVATVATEEDALEVEAAMQEALCAILFNSMGYLHELLRRD